MKALLVVGLGAILTTVFLIRFAFLFQTCCVSPAERATDREVGVVAAVLVAGPDDAGLVWTDVRGERLMAARLGSRR